MPARVRLRRPCAAAVALALLAGAPAIAQTASPPQAGAPAPADSDIAMPDDLGKPLEGVVPVRRPAGAGGRFMSLDTPVGEIASDPRGRTLLERDLPGLCERPEYTMFKGMSLRQLQPLSGGRLTAADLERVRGDLGVQHIALAPGRRRTRNPLVAGGRVVGRVTQAIYKRVVLVVASL